MNNSNGYNFNAKNVFFVEGITGSGKSTVLRQVHADLSQRHACRIDDSEEIYRKTKEYRPAFPNSLEEMAPEMAYFAFLSWARVHQRPQTTIALVDRFLLSNAVYVAGQLESFGRKDLIPQVTRELLHPLGMHPLNDGVTLYIDCPVEIAEARVLARPRSRFDRNVQDAARKNYLKTLVHADFPYRIIDGSQELRDVVSEVTELVEQSIY